jgi:RNA polymerase sigma-70 factor (ECF subfamily)
VQVTHSSIDTPGSLLERLRRPGDDAAWQRFVRLYTPLLLAWARRAGVTGDDVNDLVQDVLLTLVRKLPTFHYDHSKRFRGWLRTVTLNKWRERLRRGTLPYDAAADLAAVPGPVDEAFWEEEYRQHVVSRAVQLLRSDFEERTWHAFWQHVVLDRAAPEVAAELSMSVKAVYLAKSRVLRRLRQELTGLID